ncbi:MAG: pyridoxal-phosphate dependent enzyme [Patescibacteria group bacterium]|nr:pyridoxal-phosphate dependent enzyme [Patescibacteria group bacterium]MCL5224420.1 pyridoxal-phosphate dependent enzyme [Patescibacteria group bacterium]
MDRGYYIKNWDKWPLPVVPVPNELNPFVSDRVDLSVALAYHLPYENIKFLTVYGLLAGAESRGLLQGVHTLVEATSGNTGVTLAAMANSFGNLHVKLVVAPDLPDGKRYPLITAGAEMIPPENGLSAIATARKLGGGGWKPENWHADNGYLNLDQYANLDGAKPHADFTAPKIMEQVPYPPTVFVAGVGTGGTLVGISDYMRRNLGKIAVVGVLLSPGQEIPGVRDLNHMKEITLPWREASNDYIEIDTRPSYLASLWFNWIMGLTPGPSSGFAYLGALKFINKHKMAGTLDSLRDKQGRIHAVILFPDGNRPYGDRYMANLPFDYLKPSTAPLPWKLLW